jgi:hypothetical protein
MMGLMQIPGVGPLFAAAMMAKQARFFVLTDRRVLILPVDRSALKRADRRVSIPLGEVSLFGGGTHWAGGTRPIRAEHAGKSYLLRIPPRKKSRPVTRLLEGLRVLSADAESHPADPTPGL